MNRLREIRQKQRKSQLQLYLESGIQPSRVSYIENGHWIPSDEDKKALAIALKVDVEEVFPAG